MKKLLIPMMILMLLISAVPVLADTERQSPDATIELTNLDGTVADIDEDPDSPDGNWCDALVNNVDTVCHVSFPTPSGNPTQGTDLQEFKIWVKKWNGTGTPTVTISLYENGGLLASGSAQDVTSSTGALYTFTWNANLLSKADGSLVECYIYGTAVSGAPAGRATVSVGVVEWNVDYSTGASAPTVTTSAATNVEATTATLNGNVTNTGGENPTVTVYWGDNDGGEVAGNWDYNSAPTSPSQPQGVAAFYKNVTGLNTGTLYYFNAKATNTGGTDWGTTLSFTTKPAAPTNVSATDGDHTDKVTITWTKSTGATDYQVYRDGAPLGWIGDLATYDDTGADAPTITPGNTVAGDGDNSLYVALSLSGTSANPGTTHTYKVRAKNATGESADSATDNGNRGVGSLTYQWQRSLVDSDADYSNIDGATSSTYDDTAAPAPTVTPGTASAGDGASSSYVTLSVSGDTGNNGDGRYYQCILNATGATQQTSGSNRGYRGTTTLTYQWLRSAADSDADFSNIPGATTDPCNDTGGVVEPDGRYYYAEVSMAGASTQDTSHDRGYKSEGGDPPPPPDTPAPPSSLRLKALSETEIEATWLPSSTENATYLLMVSTIQYPDDPYGNFVVAYSGNATSVRLIGYNTELSHFKFSLWSETNPYSEEYEMAEIGAQSIDTALETMNDIMTSVVMLIPLAFLSAMAFWRNNPVLYILAGVAGFFCGLYWYDQYVTNTGLAIALSLVVFGMVCWAFAFRYIFWREE